MCTAEEGECDPTGNSALRLLDTRAGAEFHNSSHSSGHDNFLNNFNRYNNKNLWYYMHTFFQ